MATLFTILTGVGLTNLATTVTHSLGITPANLQAQVVIHQVVVTNTAPVGVNTIGTNIITVFSGVGTLVTQQGSALRRRRSDNRVNCWNPLRASTLQRKPEGLARMLEKFEDWAISSQAARTAEGSTTIPSGSRAQASSKCAASLVDEDIVSTSWETKRGRVASGRKTLVRRNRVAATLDLPVTYNDRRLTTAVGSCTSGGYVRNRCISSIAVPSVAVLRTSSQAALSTAPAA